MHINYFILIIKSIIVSYPYKQKLHKSLGF